MTPCGSFVMKLSARHCTYDPNTTTLCKTNTVTSISRVRKQSWGTWLSCSKNLDLNLNVTLSLELHLPMSWVLLRAHKRTRWYERSCDLFEHYFSQLWRASTKFRVSQSSSFMELLLSNLSTIVLHESQISPNSMKQTRGTGLSAQHPFPFGKAIIPPAVRWRWDGIYSSASDTCPKPLARMFSSGMGTCPNPGKSEPNLGIFTQTVALFLL